ncbi:hypothetical protein OXX59_003451 [Metschnikowia pulcherrima]
MTDEINVKRRRKRSTVVCLRCRQKKARCDKSFPCNQCIRANVADECLYEATGSPSETGENGPGEDFRLAVASALDFCRQKGEVPARSEKSLGYKAYMLCEYPVVPSADKMNMHMNLASLDLKDDKAASSPGFIEPKYVQVFHNFKASMRTVYPIELSQQDPAIKLYWEHNALGEKLKLMTVQNLDPSRRADAVKAASVHFGTQFFSSNRLSRGMARQKLSQYGQPLGFSYIQGCCEDDGFQQGLRKVLPAEPVLLAYLHRFFAKIYPMYPIIDEEWLFAQVERLFAFSGPEKAFSHANLASRDDVIIVSIVLFMLQLAYGSYLTNIRSQNEKILESVSVGGYPLKEVPLPLNTADLASSMLLKGNLRAKASVCLLQAHMLKNIYKSVSLDNETASCDADGISGTGALISLAISLMLERDPGQIANYPGDERQRNLRRKLWYTLVCMDYTSSYLFLTPPAIATTAFGTSLPAFSKNSCNIADKELEAKTIKNLHDTYSVVSAGYALLEMATSAVPFSGATLVQHLSDFECTVSEKLGVIDDFFEKRVMHQTPSVFKTAKFKILLCLRVFVSYISYFLHLYYRYKRNTRLGFIFLKKTLSIHMNEFEYLCPRLLFSAEKYFDASFSLMLSPLIMYIKQTSFIVASAISISLRCSVIAQKMPGMAGGVAQNPEIMRDLLTIVKESALRTQKFCKVLSERYFYAWKCSKIDSSGCKLLDEDKFYMIAPHKLLQAAMPYTDDQMVELMGCVREECSLEVMDPAEFEANTYTSLISGDDTDLQNVDLYKTLQTDNFWIVLNTLAEREYAASYLSAEDPSEATETKAPDLSAIPANEHDDDIMRTVSSLCMTDVSSNPTLFEPGAMSFVDMSLLGSSLSMGSFMDGGIGPFDSLL